MHEQLYLLQALEEAKKGRGFCSPNPAVGAVAVQNNQIIARGYHFGAGRPHAEIECMSQFPKNTPDVTLYVTLEPCNHFGRTPPCVNAIIEHGIAKVVYGILDPNDVVRALCSDEILAKYHIQSECVQVPEIQEFYKSYLHWNLHKKPWVSVKWAQTLDAKNGLKSDKLHFTNQMLHEFTHINRKNSDILLSTAQTILEDNAQFTARFSDVIYPKPLAIVDRTLRLTGQEQCFDIYRPTYIFHHESLTPLFIKENVTFIPLKITDKQVDMSQVFAIIAQLGFHDVWVEAGAKMTSHLHAKGLVNTSHIYIAPYIFGSKGQDAYDGELSFSQVPQDIQWIPMGNNVRALVNW